MNSELSVANLIVNWDRSIVEKVKIKQAEDQKFYSDMEYCLGKGVVQGPDGNFKKKSGKSPVYLVNKGGLKVGKKKSLNHKSKYKKVSVSGGEQPAEKAGKVARRASVEYELISEESDRCYSSRSDDR